ncbi:MAG: hypothetical protein KDD37_02150 [Bdellovibrionales bacterium]|nr:hypothetical protein [Bdellovibrionales bacterium]
MENKPPYDESDEDGRIKLIPEIVKKLLATGVSAAFLTEEGIRAYLQDLKLPKDILGKLIDGANKSKQDLMDRVGNEIVTIIKKIDFVKEASRFVEEHKFKVSAEIEVVRKTNDKGNN